MYRWMDAYRNGLSPRDARFKVKQFGLKKYSSLDLRWPNSLTEFLNSVSFEVNKYRSCRFVRLPKRSVFTKGIRQRGKIGAVNLIVAVLSLVHHTPTMLYISHLPTTVTLIILPIGPYIYINPNSSIVPQSFGLI